MEGFIEGWLLAPGVPPVSESVSHSRRHPGIRMWEQSRPVAGLAHGWG